MQNILKLSLIFLLFLVLPILFSQNTAQAAATATVTPSYRDENTEYVIVNFSGITKNKVWVCLRNNGHCEEPGGSSDIDMFEATVTGGKLTLELCGYENNLKQGRCGPNDFFNAGDYDVWLFPDNNYPTECPGLNFSTCTNPNDNIGQTNFEIKHFYPEVSVSPSNPKPNEKITVTLTGTRRPATRPNRNDYQVFFEDRSGTKIGGGDDTETATVPSGGSAQFEFNGAPEGEYQFRVNENGGDFNYYIIPFTIEAGGGTVDETIRDPDDVDDGENTGSGRSVAGAGSGRNPCGTECETAIGNIPTDIKGFAESILRIATGLAGGIALILMVYGSILVLTSQGDQQKLNNGREVIVAAIAGLIFLIFSVIILRFIGVNILGGIPGF